MRRLRPLPCSLVVLAALAGCGDPSLGAASGGLPTVSERGTFAVSVATEQPDFRRGTNAFDVQATDAAGGPALVTGVVARMPGHDHLATPPRIDCTARSCRVSDLVLAMPGTWEITVVLVSPGAQDDVQLSAELR